jgi:hypothetical protein
LVRYVLTTCNLITTILPGRSSSIVEYGLFITPSYESVLDLEIHKHLEALEKFSL